MYINIFILSTWLLAPMFFFIFIMVLVCLGYGCWHVRGTDQSPRIFNEYWTSRNVPPFLGWGFVACWLGSRWVTVAHWPKRWDAIEAMVHVCCFYLLTLCLCTYPLHEQTSRWLIDRDALSLRFTDADDKAGPWLAPTAPSFVSETSYKQSYHFLFLGFFQFLLMQRSFSIFFLCVYRFIFFPPCKIHFMAHPGTLLDHKSDVRNIRFRCSWILDFLKNRSIAVFVRFFSLTRVMMHCDNSHFFWILYEK